MKISVIGAGGWGTALAIQAQKNGNPVTLWAYSEDEIQSMRDHKENIDYLPGVPIPDGIVLTSDVKLASDAEMLLFVSPSKFYRKVASQFKAVASPDHLLVSATKGFEFPTEKRMSVVLEEEIPGCRDIVVISGPSHAEEVARGNPTSIVAACKNESSALEVQNALSTEMFRMYSNDDVIGVEVSAAVKNVIAVAAGMLRGLGFGDNPMAALITRGLAEIRRLGLRLGAKESTFAGLAGVGDLIVTCQSRHSRNGRVGEALGQGKKIEDILSGMKMVAEGVETVKSVMKFEEDLGIEMPISRMVYDVIYNGMDPREGMRNLMIRPLKNENI